MGIPALPSRMPVGVHSPIDSVALGPSLPNVQLSMSRSALSLGNDENDC